jgi:hypothetical protein
MVSAHSGGDWRTFGTYYKWTVSLSDRGWAWEFLRRHSGYQAAASYAATQEISLQEAQKVKSSREGGRAASWGLISFRGSSFRCKKCHGVLATGCLFVDSPRHFLPSPFSRFCDNDPACSANGQRYGPR